MSSTMSGVLLVSLTLARLPPVPTTVTTSTSTSTTTVPVASLRTATALHQSTAEIAMSGSSLPIPTSTTNLQTTTPLSTPSSTTTTTPTTPSRNSNSTMVSWIDALVDVQDEKKQNKKSAADDAQHQLVPHQGRGQASGSRRPIHKGKKKGEEQAQLSTHGDWGVNEAAAADNAAAADAVATVSFSRENLNLKGDKSLRQYQQQYQYQYPNQQSPPSLSLTDLIDDEAMEVKRNVDLQFLMDFAVIGHPKCGTTFLLRKWLGQHAEIVMPARETRVLSGSTGAVQMVQALYPLQQLPVAPVPLAIPSTRDDFGSGGNDLHGSPPVSVKRGYKNPAHILRPWALKHFETYWPASKLIIGVRHPVLWFESFYNYRLIRDELPPPASLMGACTDRTMNDVCTDNANFHVHLAMLGKTNLTALERVLFETNSTMSRRVPRRPKNQMHLPNPVFLYDVSQLDGSNVDVSESVRRSMQDYLGLQQPLPELESARSSSTSSSSSKGPSVHNTLDICLPEHESLRKQLLQIAWHASEWITTYFLPLSDVTVPAPEQFRSVLLNDWRRDPCETRKSTTRRPGPSP
jgi:hypothetical protein